jgi:hypothetical protein
VRFAVRSSNLFETIDDDRDARLSRLELLRFADRIAGTGDVATVQDLSQGLTLAIGPAESWLLRAAGASPAAMPVAAPRWFQSMDVNGDGAVSLREFLPPRERFEKLDANRDGLLEPSEAALATDG